jgi:haloalkane dehalogenase
MTRQISALPFASKKYLQANGRRMAYIDEGEGDAIVFQHGNPTSSYLWRNVMRHLSGTGRLVACDLIGMGDSEKLTPSGPDRYHYEEQRSYLFALWDALGLGDRVVLVLHDWGSALGFDWAMQNPGRVQGIAYMEAIVGPLLWADYPQGARRSAFQDFRSPEGDSLVLERNVFVERVLPGSIQRQLTDVEMAEYRRPFLKAGEDRRPTLSWPRDLPIEGEPRTVARIAEAYGAFIAASQVPKLFIDANPGALLTGRLRDLCRTWPNQTEISVSGLHFVQEDSPHEIGEAVAAFVRRLRPASAGNPGSRV